MRPGRAGGLTGAPASDRPRRAAVAVGAVALELGAQLSLASHPPTISEQCVGTREPSEAPLGMGQRWLVRRSLGCSGTGRAR